EGNLTDVTQAGSLHQFLQKLHWSHGPIASFWWGTQQTVSIASPELFKEHQHVFDRPALLFKMFEPLVGSKCIQFANGEDGRHRRAVYDQYFTADAVATYFDTLHRV
ncbi:PREDICTED: cytochrome P450 20A1-like, partial [Priapulus caudatus]|uniref:Cytochrome P450 20A1-like n=1 Tax=Priapulus caudatus TaxID=37621 RepID=A0ABM1F7B1_PRICU